MTLKLHLLPVLCCALLGVLFVWADTDFESCETGVPRPLRFSVGNCTWSPCQVDVNIPITISASFKLDHNVTAIPLVMSNWFTRWINLTFSHDACLTLDPPVCPPEGEIFTFDIDIVYTRRYGPIVTELTAYDQDSRPLACARYSVNGWP